jgi:hypothetical protein
MAIKTSLLTLSTVADVGSLRRGVVQSLRVLIYVNHCQETAKVHYRTHMLWPFPWFWLESSGLPYFLIIAAPVRFSVKRQI